MKDCGACRKDVVWYIPDVERLTLSLVLVDRRCRRSQDMPCPLNRWMNGRSFLSVGVVSFVGLLSDDALPSLDMFGDGQGVVYIRYLNP